MPPVGLCCKVPVVVVVGAVVVPPPTTGAVIAGNVQGVAGAAAGAVAGAVVLTVPVAGADVLPPVVGALPIAL